MIILNEKGTSIETLKKRRTRRENSRIEGANKDIKKIDAKQKMFWEYCEAVNRIIPLGR